MIIVAKLLGSAIIAVVGAGYGVLISVLATSAATAASEAGRWDAIGLIMLGSVLVQLIAQLSGAGWGLLLGSSALAIVADVAVPLELWIVACAIPALHGVQAWLTPFASVQNLLQATWTLRIGPRWVWSCLCGWLRSVPLGYSGCATFAESSDVEFFQHRV